MSRRDNRANRCGLCLMHMGLCVCPLVPRIETKTRLALVIHHTEIRKPTNTGHLGAACLVNSEVHIRGREGVPSAPLAWGDRTPLLLFPHEGEAEPLAPVFPDPVMLIVPDGNWRQASKVRARVPGLKNVRCVTLPPGPPSIYRLRSEAHPEGLATIEAIARAMGILEGPHVQAALEHVFRAMVERTLWSRGAIAAGDVTGGIPEGATRHDPRSGLADRRRTSLLGS
ncbi:MAG: DTW domain-containing protein [Labilithrix sp.]|nr:DTW domain-containing protein [Labilithrix sp.]MBX3223622.1 DTW domain-containing protein [Labilithrix sp.]